LFTIGQSAYIVQAPGKVYSRYIKHKNASNSMLANVLAANLEDVDSFVE